MQENTMRKRKRTLPDDVYIAMEPCIEEVMEILKRPGNESHLNGPAYHLVSREFRSMFMDSHREYMVERMKKAKTSKDKDK